MFEMPLPKTIISFASAAKLRASRSLYVANDRTATDLPCTWQHFSVPPSAVDADAMSDGIGFDGSLIRGFQEVQESDMLVVSARGAVVDVAFGAGELPLWIKLLSYIGAYRDPDR